MIFCIKYQAGTYSGVKKVEADDKHEAVDQVKRWVRERMTIPVYYESYRIVYTIEEALEGDE